jgi:hypothetical protein
MARVLFEKEPAVANMPVLRALRHRSFLPVSHPNGIT